MTCPSCLRTVVVEVSDDGSYTCPSCGYQGKTGGGESKEGIRRMSDSNELQRLLSEASKAPTVAKAQELLAQAETVRSRLRQEHVASRDLDLSDELVNQRLTPVRVHEHHTAATDWIGDLYTTSSADQQSVEREMVAQGSLWYGNVAHMVKVDSEEFGIQAQGQARKLSGAYGEIADAAENAFLSCVASLRDRDMRTGALREAASGLPQVGEGGYPAEQMAGLQVDLALPGEATTSERAPAIQELEANNGAGASQSVTEVNDPGIARSLDGGEQNPEQAQAGRKEAAMQHANCPTCGGHGKVAVRVAPLPSVIDIVAGRHTAYSNLPQVDQIADGADNPAPTPLPTEVAWPWEMQPGAVQQTIQTAEQQIAEREQRKGASRQQLAQQVARQAYAQVMQMTGGQDDSGWLGDMGATPPGPGQQDGGNPPSSNLGAPDPVYGYGGDQGDRPMKPFGADEADDYTNNPGQMWQPGQPAQADVAGRGMSTQGSVDQQIAQDAEIQKALAFVRQRRAHLTKKLAQG